MQVIGEIIIAWTKEPSQMVTEKVTASHAELQCKILKELKCLYMMWICDLYIIGGKVWWTMTYIRGWNRRSMDARLHMKTEDNLTLNS